MPIRALILVLLAAVAVSGCGRRGPLEAPPASAGAVSADAAVAVGAGVSPLDPGSSPPAAAPATTATPQQPAPRRRFFLDFLL